MVGIDDILKLLKVTHIFSPYALILRSNPLFQRFSAARALYLITEVFRDAPDLHALSLPSGLVNYTNLMP